ncbi:hypothetical protein Tco_1468647 [Tanacetum coccineum]
MTALVTTIVAANASAVWVSKDRVRSGNLETFGDSASTGGANMNAASSSKLNEPTTSSYSFYASQDLDSETLHNIYVPKWKVTNDSALNDPYVCRDLTDHLAPLALFSQLRSMDYDQLYTEFDVRAARQICLGVECAEQTTLLSEKDAEIAHLRSLLSLKETEAAEAIRLRSQLSVVEVADTAKSNELRDLKEINFALKGEKDALSEKVATLESMTTSKETELASLTAQVLQLTSNLSGFQLSPDELSSKVAFLESKRDMLADQSAFELFKGRMEAMQDEQTTVMGNGVAELDAQLLEMAAHLDEDIQDGLKAGVDHGKAGRGLSVIEAYDPSAEAKYIDAVNTLGTIDFSLLSELKSKKDARMVDLIDSLYNVVLGETSLSFSLQVVHSRVQRVRGEIKEKRLSLTNVMVPLAEPLSAKSLIGEASTSAIHATTEHITTLSTTFASSDVVPPLSISNDQALDTKPNDEDPPAVTFKKEELVTSSK